MQGVAFLPWPELHDPVVADIVDQAFQDLASQALPRHLASAKEDGGFDLVPLVQEPQHVILFGIVIVVVHVNAELDLFYGDRLLMLLRLALFLLLLIKVFAVIHDAANGRLCGGRDLDQVQILFAGHFERFVGRDDADLLSFIINYANFACPNTIIGADKTFIDTVLPKAD